MNAEIKYAPVLTLLRGGRIEGELPIVTPGPIDHLAEEDLATIREAEALHEGGKEGEALAIITALEQRLGITPADKARAFAPQEPWEGDLLAALGYTPADPEITALGRDYRRLNEAEAKELEAAARELARAKTPGNKELARSKIARIGARLHQRIELKERAAGIAETVALAKDRGEEVDEKPPIGGANIRSRDGLQRMADLGHITQAQLKVARIYREGHEARGADLKAQVITDAGGGAGHDNDAFVAKHLERAKLLDFTARVDRQVALACISNPNALNILRSVAGDGLAITSFGSGRALERNRAALSQALEIAVRIDAEDRRKRGEG